MRTQTIKFGDFMNGTWKEPRKSKTLLAGSVGATLPLVVSTPAFANPVTDKVAEAGAEATLETMAHMLDPIVDVLVALSFPVASVIIVGGLFFFMFGNAEKAWSTIQRASLGYVLIQLSPLILDVLKNIGDSM